MGGRGSREKNTKVLFPLLLLFIAPGREREKEEKEEEEREEVKFSTVFLSAPKKGKENRSFLFLHSLPLLL